MVREIVGTIRRESPLCLAEVISFGSTLGCAPPNRGHLPSKGETAGKGDVGIGRHASCELWGVGSLKDPLERPSYANYAGMMC